MANGDTISILIIRIFRSNCMHGYILWIHRILVINNLVIWLAEHNVMGNAYVISEEKAFYSNAERIVDRFNQGMKEVGMLFEDTKFLS